MLKGIPLESVDVEAVEAGCNRQFDQMRGKILQDMEEEVQRRVQEAEAVLNAKAKQVRDLYNAEMDKMDDRITQLQAQLQVRSSTKIHLTIIHSQNLYFIVLQEECKASKKLCELNNTFREMLIHPGKGGKREKLMWVCKSRHLAAENNPFEIMS